jgi:hypothetical protein
MSDSDLSQAIIVRVGSVLVAVGLALILPAALLFVVLVAFAQGHFALAYIYQAEGGKLPLRKVIILLGLLAFLIWVALMLPLPVFTFITAIGFLIHFAIDEPRFMKTRHSLFTTLEALPFIIMYSSIIADVTFAVHTFPIALALSLVVLCIYAAVAVVRKRRPNIVSYFFLGWFLVTLAANAIYYSQPSYVVAWVWFDCLVITHISMWYGSYWFKLARKPVIRMEFVLRACVINCVFLFLGYLWTIGLVPLFFVLFAPASYYVWTFLHGFATFRKAEWIDSLSL